MRASAEVKHSDSFQTGLFCSLTDTCPRCASAEAPRPSPGPEQHDFFQPFFLDYSERFLHNKVQVLLDNPEQQLDYAGCQG